jgi:hypothetical protein
MLRDAIMKAYKVVIAAMIVFLPVTLGVQSAYAARPSSPSGLRGGGFPESPKPSTSRSIDHV